MDKIMTQLDLLTEHFMGSNPKTVNALATRGNKKYEDDDTDSLDEDIHFLSNRIGGSRPTY